MRLMRIGAYLAAHASSRSASSSLLSRGHMPVRVVCFAGFLSLAVGCAPSPRSEVFAPAPRLLDLTTLVLPTVDSATLASLGALLDSLQRSSARTPLAMREPR